MEEKATSKRFIIIDGDPKVSLFVSQKKKKLSSVVYAMPDTNQLPKVKILCKLDVNRVKESVEWVKNGPLLTPPQNIIFTVTQPVF